MTEAVILKIIVGVFISSVFGLNVKIVWDWLCRSNNNNAELKFMKDEFIKIRPEIDDIKEKLDNISKVISGNGNIDKSIVFRMASIEEAIKEFKKIRESRSL